jgi:hypothetical protein
VADIDASELNVLPYVILLIVMFVISRSTCVVIDVIMVPYCTFFLVDRCICLFLLPTDAMVIRKGEASRFQLAEMPMTITNTHLFSIPTAFSAASNQSKLM